MEEIIYYLFSIWRTRSGSLQCLHKAEVLAADSLCSLYCTGVLPGIGELALRQLASNTLEGVRSSGVFLHQSSINRIQADPVLAPAPCTKCSWHFLPLKRWHLFRYGTCRWYVFKLLGGAGARNKWWEFTPSHDSGFKLPECRSFLANKSSVIKPLCHHVP